LSDREQSILRQAEIEEQARAGNSSASAQSQDFFGSVQATMVDVA